MNVPKNKEIPRPRAKVEPVEIVPAGTELTPEWQAEFMAGLRLERARIPNRFSGKTLDNFKVDRNSKRKGDY